MMMKLNRIKLLGEGAFASVYLEQDEISKQLYATKIINEKKIGPQAKKYLENEIKILNMINHQNIIKLYHVLKSQDYTFLVMEYCNGDSLYKNLYTNNHGQPFPERLVQRIMKKLLTGVNFLHQNGIIHRDLKLGNILLKYENELNKDIYSAEIKIIDFNSSYIHGTSEPKTFVGTVPYMAPSVAQKYYNPYNSYPYNEKIDIWSLGIICYEMLFGKRLFPNKNDNEIINNILICNFKIPKTISVQARTFLLSMLQKDEINRLSASQLLNHEFIIGDYHNFTKYSNGININNNLNQEKYFQNNINIQYNKKFKLYNKCGGNLNNNLIYKCEECYDFKYCETCYLIDNNKHRHKFRIINNNINNDFYNFQNPIKTFTKIKKNIIFKYDNGKEPINIIVDVDFTLRDLLISFFKRINRPDLVENWGKKFSFIYNGNKLPPLESRVKNIFKNTNATIYVNEIGNLNNNFKYY